MCYPLFKRNMKLMIKPLIAMIMILAMYYGVIIYMYDPKLIDMLDDYQKMMPEMMSAFGMTGSTDTLLKFMNTYLYGFLMMLLPLILIIIMGNNLLMKYEDSGSLACILASPYSRIKVIITQTLSMIISVIALMLCVSFTGICFANIMFPGELDIKPYLLLNVFTLLLQLSVSAIVFCSACIFQESKNYYIIGCGLPLMFYLFSMLGNMGDAFSWMSRLSLYSLLPSDKIVNCESGLFPHASAIIIIIIILYGAGIVRFVKKDLFL